MDILPDFLKEIKYYLNKSSLISIKLTYFIILLILYDSIQAI